MDNIKKEIEALQRNLSTLRKIAEMTSAELGKKIGVTKQTISNLENNKTPMSLTQYIAIRTIFDCEMQQKNDNLMLILFVNILLDKHELFSEEEFEKIIDCANIIATTTNSGFSKNKQFEFSINILKSTEVLNIIKSKKIDLEFKNLIDEIQKDELSEFLSKKATNASKEEIFFKNLKKSSEKVQGLKEVPDEISENVDQASITMIPGTRMLGCAKMSPSSIFANWIFRIQKNLK